jgi:hypothetical protein
MTRTIPALTLLALALTACTATPQPPADPEPAITHTVTASASATTSVTAAPDGPVAACNAVHTEGAVAPGEGPTPEQWTTSIVVTNLGPTPCSLEGISELAFFTGGDGSPLPVKQVVTTDDVPIELVVLDVGDQASMSLYFPSAPEDDAPADCLVGTGVVDITLPADHEPLTAQASLPPVCGAVSVTPWGFGGAPGVAPN